MVKKNVVEETDAAKTLKPDSKRTATNTSFDPATSKSEAMKALVALIGPKSLDDINGFIASLSQIGKEAEKVPGTAEHNRDTIKAHPSAAIGSVKEDLEKVFGESATPDFIEKSTAIFENVVEAKCLIKEQELTEAYEAKLVEALEKLTTESADKLDAYMDYLAQTWFEENQVAIEANLKTEAVKDLVDGLKKVFSENNINIPEGSETIVDQLRTENTELKSKLEKQIQESIELSHQILENTKKLELDKLSEGLTVIEKSKLKKLAEGIESTSLDEFKTKAETLKEQLTKKPASKTGLVNEEVTHDPNEIIEESVNIDPMMKAYVDALERTGKV